MRFPQRNEAGLARGDKNNLSCFRHSEADGRQYGAKREGEQVLQVRRDESQGGHRRAERMEKVCRIRVERSRALVTGGWRGYWVVWHSRYRDSKRTAPSRYGPVSPRSCSPTFLELHDLGTFITSAAPTQLYYREPEHVAPMTRYCARVSQCLT